MIPVLKTALTIKLGDEEVLLEAFVDISRLKQTEEDLNARLEELELFNRLAVGRELEMVELKEEINRLLVENGYESKYEIVT